MPNSNPLLNRYLAGNLPSTSLIPCSPLVAERLFNELINQLKINPADYLVINDHESIKIVQARTIKNFTLLTRFTSPIKLVLITNANSLTPEAANCLLKTLEEPPTHCHLILAAIKTEALLPTVRSRCQLIDLKLIIEESPIDQSLPALTVRPLVEYFQIAKDLAASEISLPTLFNHWIEQLKREQDQSLNLNQSAKQIQQSWLKLTLDFLIPAQTTVNRRLLLDNFFLQIYNSNRPLSQHD